MQVSLNSFAYRLIVLPVVMPVALAVCPTWTFSPHRTGSPAGGDCVVFGGPVVDTSEEGRVVGLEPFFVTGHGGMGLPRGQSADDCGSEGTSTKLSS